MVELLQLTQAVMTATAIAIAIPVAILSEEDIQPQLESLVNSYEQVDRY